MKIVLGFMPMIMTYESSWSTVERDKLTIRKFGSTGRNVKKGGWFWKKKLGDNQGLEDFYYLFYCIYNANIAPSGYATTYMIINWKQNLLFQYLWRPRISLYEIFQSTGRLTSDWYRNLGGSDGTRRIDLSGSARYSGGRQTAVWAHQRTLRIVL